MAITDESIGASGGGHVPRLPSPKSTPMLRGDYVTDRWVCLPVKQFLYTNTQKRCMLELCLFLSIRLLYVCCPRNQPTFPARQLPS